MYGGIKERKSARETEHQAEHKSSKYIVNIKQLRKTEKYQYCSISRGDKWRKKEIVYCVRQVCKMYPLVRLE